MTQCPHCMTDVHEDARVCASCGATKGFSGPGVSLREIYTRAALPAIVGVFPLLFALGRLFKGDMIGFVILTVLAMIPLGVAAWIFSASRQEEKWWR